MELDADLHCLGQAQNLITPELGAHQDRVGRLAAYLTSMLELGAEFAGEMSVAAGFHDVGKLVVPDPVLRKPGPLDAAEWDKIKRHPVAGYAILAGTQNRVVQLAATVALFHQERYDGSGYPYGIAGKDIPLPGRIASLCDVYDALREDRPYRPGLSHDEAMTIVVTGDSRTRPGHFDPDMLAAFANNERGIAAIYRSRM